MVAIVWSWFLHTRSRVSTVVLSVFSRRQIFFSVDVLSSLRNFS